VLLSASAWPTLSAAICAVVSPARLRAQLGRAERVDLRAVHGAERGRGQAADLHGAQRAELRGGQRARLRSG
jgi:hypothetical protein